MPIILVIDDEEPILQYLAKVLSQIGYEVRTANDGVSGYDKAKDPNVQMIICDLIMPGTISGMNLIQKIRTLRPRCPIVIVTGYPTDTNYKEAKELNVEMLTKPFEIPFVTALVKRLLPLPNQPISSTHEN